MADDDEFDFITGTMTEIRRNWGETLQERFNPIVMALEMLQETNASRSHEAFMRLYDGLEEAMSIIVESTLAWCPALHPQLFPSNTSCRGAARRILCRL